MTTSTSGIKIAIDRGGTFTDVLGIIPGKPDLVLKILSVDPANYPDATIEGIRRVLSHVTGRDVPRGEPLDTTDIDVVRMGTTIATNALLERKGTRCALLITRGFGDLIRVGDQTRPDLFALNVQKPDVLYDRVLEVDERVTLEAFDLDPEEKSLIERVDGVTVTQGVTGEVIRVLKPLDEASVTQQLLQLRSDGFDSIAVALAHGYNFQDHEKKIGEIAKMLGYSHISLSHSLLPTIRLVNRGHSTVADAYLTPSLKIYIEGFLQGFKTDSIEHTRFEFMQSDGGLTSYDKFCGLRAILSGPAGGVVGYARSCYDDHEKKPLVGFDMGGTSTDVSRFGGMYEHITNSVTAGVHISCPQLDVNTVAAGGGSILAFKNGLFEVGPDSAGAHPGPACYGKGGPLTVTDANLLLGRLIPDTFPNIFGPNENEPLNRAITQVKFQQLTDEINKTYGEDRPSLTVEDVAMGFLEIANIQMAKPIRALTESRGFDVSAHDLASFGGAGGQHACDIAQSLNISRIMIHKYSSILSAYGMALADIVEEKQEPSAKPYNETTRDVLNQRLEHLAGQAKSELIAQQVPVDSIRIEKFLNMRYHGSDSLLIIPVTDPNTNALDVFTETHHREFSFINKESKVIVDDIRVRATGAIHQIKEQSPYSELKATKTSMAQLDNSTKYRDVFFGSEWVSTPVFNLSTLKPGVVVPGPAMLIDATQTVVVDPSATATMLARHLVIDVVPKNKKNISANEVDPIQLSIFGHRFMAIAEEMGRTLQKISVSANIKERLDFSCALFDNGGKLTANAPHVPAHLGSMSRSIKIAIEHWSGNLKPGDVLCTNHPAAGGTHLPDITVISPVFDSTGKYIDFFIASRAHHAEIGGLTPGSMPSNSVELYQEGAAFEQWKIISEGRFDDEGVKHHFIDVPGSYPGCSPTRRVKDNIADLKAQVAAGQKGIYLIHRLFEEYDRDTVLFYMGAVNLTAEAAVRGLLKKMAKQFEGQLPLKAIDHMDDGSPIVLTVSICESTGSAVFDFTGTGLETYNCYNAPIAITYSSILYCLRCLIGTDIPLNEGCLAPIEIIVPPGCMLNPSYTAAVCAGNGCMSQRITDTIFKAFQACAASYGCMNVFSFGQGGRDEVTGEFKPGYGYTETIGGGSGAGPGWNGFSGSQCHMTNTKITDPEVLEKRYPLILHQFCIRPDSGGDGQWQGGCGLIREFEFTTSSHVSLLMQRRSYAPYGMAGGREGAKGVNLMGKKLADGSYRWVNVGGSKELKAEVGDKLKICTPGGGGYGTPLSAEQVLPTPNISASASMLPNGSEQQQVFGYKPRANGSINAYINTQLSSS